MPEKLCFPQTQYLTFMKKIFYLVVVLLSSSVFAQKPCFTTNASQGCVPFTVSLTDCSNGGKNLIYQYDPVGRPRDTIAATTFTYIKPGIYKIVQWGSFNAQGDSTSQTITVLPVPMPDFAVSYCAANQVAVKITDTNYDGFVIDFGDGTPAITAKANAQVLHAYADNTPKIITVAGTYAGISCGNTRTQTITPLPALGLPVWLSLQTPTPTSFDLRFQGMSYLRYQLFQQDEAGNEILLSTFEKNANPLFTYLAQNLDSTQQYRYRIKALDDCGNSAFSGVVAKMPLNVQAGSRQMLVSWKAYPNATDFRYYLLLRNEQQLAMLTDLSINSFLDKDVVCGRKYCYRLVTQLGNALTSVSQTVCRTGISTQVPPAVTNVLATIDNEKAVLTWLPPANFTIKSYTITKSDGTVNVVTQNKFQDTTRFDRQVCYTIQLEDSCGNRSLQTARTCPVFLSLNPATEKLEWTAYESGQGAVQEYLVELVDEQGKVTKSTSAGTTLQFADYPDLTTQVLHYRIRAVAGNLNSYSNVITITQTARLVVPSAFSPNDDAFNNTFMADGIFIKTFNMAVYNRWGQVIFATTDLSKGWDGKLNNTPAPAASYVYTVEAADFTGKPIKRQGTFMLLR